MSILLSVTLPCTSSTALSVREFSPVLFPVSVPPPAHWLDVARPIYRFFAHPLTMALGWTAAFLLSALCCYGWLLVVML
jgi:hypothetical protein